MVHLYVYMPSPELRFQRKMVHFRHMKDGALLTMHMHEFRILCSHFVLFLIASAHSCFFPAPDRQITSWCLWDQQSGVTKTV